MSEQTFHAREPLGAGLGAASGREQGLGAAHWLRARWRWPAAALVLLILSVLVVAWARVRPGYDPYGWLGWGHLTIHGKLDTDGAPSWKPLPFLFTLPYALVGRHALYLWMTTAFAVSLSGVVFAWRVAFRLVAAPPERRYAAYGAGLVAGLAVLGIQDYPHSILSAESDTMIVALCLAAVDCILNRRYRWAFWLWWLAALGRPEVWAPMGLYVLWAWRSVPGMRRQMIVGVILIPLLWFAIPALTSKSPFSAASLAENSPRALHGNKITGTFGRFLALNATPVKLAAGVAVVLAVLRRDRAVLVLAGGTLLWVVVEIAFALHGWSAVPRYIYEAGAGVCVLAGVGIGRVILDVGPAVDRLSRRGSRQAFRHGSPQASRQGSASAFRHGSPALAGWLAAALVAVFAISVVPVAHARINAERKDLHGQRVRTSYINMLTSAVQHVGPARILACGQPNIGIGWQSILAWQLGTNTGVLYFHLEREREHPYPVVKFYPHSYGWQIFPSGLRTRTQAVRCRGLRYRT